MHNLTGQSTNYDSLSLEVCETLPDDKLDCLFGLGASNFLFFKAFPLPIEAAIFTA